MDKRLLGDQLLREQGGASSQDWSGRSWGGVKTPTDAVPQPPEMMSGNKGNLHGLKDFSGEWKSSSGRPLVLQTGVYDQLETAQALMKGDPRFMDVWGNSLAKSGKSFDDWRPTSLNYTYRPTSEQAIVYSKLGANQAAAPGTSPYEGGLGIDTHISEMSKEQYDMFDFYMKKAGFEKVKNKDGTEKESEKHHYQYMNGYANSSEAIKDVNKGGANSDAAVYDRLNSNKKFNTNNNQNISPSRGRSDSKGILKGDISNGPNIAATYFTAGNHAIAHPTDNIQQQYLNNLNGQVARLDVDQLRSDQRDMEDVKSVVGKTAETGYPDKLRKNVYTDKSQLGFEDKLDTPVHIRIFTDEVAVGSDQSNLTEAWKDYKRTNIPYIDCFVLRSVRFVQEERYHIFQALNGETTSFFFGSKPVIYNFSGVLLDTNNQQWFNDFMYYYEHYLRGTRVILNKTRIFMIYEDQIVEGFLLDSNVSRSAETNSHAEFSFNMIMVQKTTTAQYTNPINRNTTETSINNELNAPYIAAQNNASLAARHHADMMSRVSRYRGSLLHTGQATLSKASGRLLVPPTVDPKTIVDQLTTKSMDSLLSPPLSVPSQLASGVRQQTTKATTSKGSLAAKDTVVIKYADLTPVQKQTTKSTVERALGRPVPELPQA